MSWDFESNGGGKAEFTKFPVGVTRIRIIDDEPFVRWTHWLPAFKRSVNCPGKGCAICEIRKKQKANKEQYSYAMGRRFAIQILNRETGKLEICEQGIGFFEDLRDVMNDLREKGKSLKDVDIKVRRRGTGKDDTSYRIDVDEEYPLSDADIILLDGAIDLAEYMKANTPEQTIRLVNGESWDDVMKPENNDEEIEVQ